MARNYHPNMIILLLRFQELLKVSDPDQYDDWGLFLETLRQVDEKEKNFLLNLFTIAIAFDGKISHFEKETVQAAFGNLYDAYQPRLIALIGHLKCGRLHAAAALCKLDFTAD
jgi:hypothetical protein